MEGELNRNGQNRRFEFTADDADAHTRLDVFLVERLQDLSRSHIQKYLNEKDLILVNGRIQKPHYRIKPGDFIQIVLPQPEKTRLTAVAMALDILFEDEDLLVINKAPGLPVHPSPGHENDTVVNALLHYLGETGGLSDIGGEFRPGIVHRLDKDTSGVLLVAKNNFTHERLSRNFAERRIEKTYEAIVKGEMRQNEGVIDLPVARSAKDRKKFTVSESGREAVTEYRVIEREKGTTWLSLRPKTGRTHQLRVHLAHIGHPLIGDPIYSRRAHQSAYIALVAKQLSITHPRTGKLMTFYAPYPPHFLELAHRYGYDI
jgi:23S rRNA pseudouridine1911/1915/1917 synthase